MFVSESVAPPFTQGGEAEPSRCWVFRILIRAESGNRLPSGIAALGGFDEPIGIFGPYWAARVLSCRTKSARLRRWSRWRGQTPIDSRTEELQEGDRLMRTVSARGFGLFSGIVWTVAAGSVDAATFSLQAVLQNGTNLRTCSGLPANTACTQNSNCPNGQSCRGRNSLTVAPNQEITADIFVSGWGAEMPLGIRAFSANLLGVAGFQSGDNGIILPLGWDAPVDPDNVDTCLNDADCIAADPRYPDCSNGECIGLAHDPESGALIDRLRPDFILFPRDGLFPIDLLRLNYRYVGLSDESVGTLDTGTQRYCGTVIMRVSANACGVFTVGFKTGIGLNTSFLSDPAPSPIIVYPDSQPLTMTVSPCARQLVSCGGEPQHSNPGHGTIDARIAHDRLNAGQRLNWNTFLMHFSAATAGMNVASFEVSQIPPDLEPGTFLPAVSTVTPAGNDATVVLTRRINQTRWTCIRDVLSNKRCCFGSLPGDANTDRTSIHADVFTIMANLNGGVSPALALEKCDTDRSTRCLPPDILMVVDLLNGAGAFRPTIGDGLESPPGMLIP